MAEGVPLRLASNLHSLCARHHACTSAALWEATRDPATGATTWTSPLGRVYEARPPPRGQVDKTGAEPPEAESPATPEPKPESELPTTPDAESEPPF